MITEQRGPAAVSWRKGTRHLAYEDRYRILSRDIPLVAQAHRGELFAVFDGIGSAPRGMSAAQEMADSLVRFYREPDTIECTLPGLQKLLMEANRAIQSWGLVPGTNRSIGGCAGTIAWLASDRLTVYHAGDTTALIIRDSEPNMLTRMHQAADGALVRYFGLGQSLVMDVHQHTIEEFDRILLLSDGITKVLHPFEAAAVTDNFQRISQATEALVHRALTLGATDDITAMLVQVEEIWEQGG